VRHGPRPSKTATWICGGSKIHPDLPIRTGAVSLPGRQAKRRTCIASTSRR